METTEFIDGKYPWKNDVAVLCIFWIRADCFQRSFESVRNARPRILLLWQDGPRENTISDREKWRACQRIAENIDWNCEVHRFYHEENIGIWPGAFLSHKWAFSIVDKCIILEDDVVPSQSFYMFCKELLDRYEFDERIGKISGTNQVKSLNIPYSYSFVNTCSSWGWATWRRVADLWESDYRFLDDSYTMKLYQYKYKLKTEKNYVKTCIGHSRENRADWETVESFALKLNAQLCIIPSMNLINNVGVGVENSVHFNLQLADMPKKQREIFFSPAGEMDFPLIHPPYVIENKAYVDEYYKLTGANNPFKRCMNICERVSLYLIHGNLGKLLQGLKKRIKRKFGWSEY